MQCVNCDTEILAGKRFCHQCGTAVQLRCASCGATLYASFRFCPDCGTATGSAAAPAETTGSSPAPAERLDRLRDRIPETLAEKIRASRPVMGGERKLVTVLFCDLVGSTAIAERLDPEDYRELLDRYLELAFREIYRFEGIVNQLAGDGMMALFGAPIAHEDAPHRAVQAALAIREALDVFNRESCAERGIKLRIRIGINTGPVVVGNVGNDLKMDYTAIGDTTNLAARLEALAEAGKILISESTHRLVRGFFEVRPAVSFTVKGKSEPVNACEVIGLAETRTPMALAEARGMTPFVGRRNELAQLEGCYERLLGNLPQVVSIVGEAGGGKSRLLYEFKRLRAADELVLFEARCSALAQSVPYAPFVSMLRQYFELREREPASASAEKIAEKVRRFDPDLDKMYPYFCRLLSVQIDGIADRPADELRRETFEAIAHLVIGVSLESAVVLLMEDLHWVDEATREMLELSVQKLRAARIMFLFTHRPEFQPAWRTRAALTQLNLMPLPQADSRAVIRSIAGGQVPDALEGSILTRAEGNPFFLEEITRALVEEGYLLPSDGRVELSRPPEEIQIPGTIQELIAARLDRLGPWAKRVAQVAAVFGRQFRRDDLTRLLETEEIDVGVELEELERRGIIHRKDALSLDEFRFGESLTQEVAYESLLLRERRTLHERTAFLLDERLGESGEGAALVAHHFARSDNRAKAVETMLRAAEHAEKLPSYPAALGFFRDAWTIVSQVVGETGLGPVEFRMLARRTALGLCRFAVFYGAPDVAAAERAAQLGRALSEEANDPEGIATFYLFEGMILGQAPRDRAGSSLALIERGVAVAQAAGLDLVALNLSRGLAWGYYLDGRFEVARSMLESVVGKLDELGIGAKLTDTYFGGLILRNMATFHADDVEAAAARWAETYELALAASNRTVQAGSSIGLSWIHFVRGEYAEAKRLAERALEIAEAIGNAGMIRSAAALFLGSRLEIETHPATGRYLDLIEQTVTAPSGDFGTRIHLFVEVLLGADEIERARRLAEFAEDHGQGRYRQALSSLALGNVLLASGPEHWEAADDALHRAATVARELGSRSTLGLALLGEAELAAARGELPVAVARAAKAAELLAEIGYRRYEARARRLVSPVPLEDERRDAVG